MLEKINTTLTLVIIGGIGVAGFLVYNWLKNGDAGSTDQAGQTSSLLGALQGTNSIDPETGDSNGLLNSINNVFVPTVNPGGGEVTGSSETFTGAAEETLSHPLSSIEAIFGFNPN